MQASVKRVHRSIEDKLLSSQEKARKVRNAKKGADFFLLNYICSPKLVFKKGHCMEKN